MYFPWIISLLILIFSEECCCGWLKDLGKAVTDVTDATANGELCWSNCGWTEWGEWSRCSRTCGGGTHRRKRGLCGWAWLSNEEKLDRCDKNAADQFQSGPCGSSCLHGAWSSYTKSCRCQPHYRGTCCDTMVTHWSEWGQWSSCSQTCTKQKQPALRQRTRNCVKARYTDSCIGVSTEKRACAGIPICPVNYWSEWLQWSDCTTTCNSGNIIGTRSRSRICVKLAQDGSCPGYANEEEQCQHLQTCPETTTVPQITSTSNPVQFTVTPNNVTSEPGGVVVFECATLPEHMVFWYHNGFPVTEDDPSGWYEVLTGGVFIVSSVGEHHVGEYMCEVYTDQGPLQTSAWLTIPQQEEDMCQIEIVTIPYNVTVPEGSLAMLQCHSQNRAPVLWYKQVQSPINPASKDIYDDGQNYYLSRLYENMEELQVESGMNETVDYTMSRDLSDEGPYRIYLGGTGSPQVDDAERSRHFSDDRELVEGVSVLRNGYLMLESAKESHGGTYTCEIHKDNCTLSYNATVTVYTNISQVCGTQVNNRSRWFSPDQEGHIVNGNEASVGSAPWQVLMEESSVGFFCGGVLISRYWMVTAAHCFSNFRKRYRRKLNNHNLMLKMGKHQRVLDDPFEQEKQMTQKIIHPRFNPRTFNNDIALIKFSSAVDFNDYVRPACLPALEDAQFRESITPGKHGIITGWGRTTEGGLPASTLREIQVRIQPQAVCTNSTASEVTASMFCAGDQANLQDACKGDSGGPFVVPVRQADGHPRWHIAGAVSWGIGCGRHGNYGFYTNITRAMPWIQGAIGEL